MPLGGRENVVLLAGKVGSREQREQARALRAPERRGDLIARERRVIVERILQRRGERAEVALTEGGRRHGSQTGNAVAAVLIFPGDEEESSIAPDRASQRCAVLIADERKLARREEIAR